MQQQIEDYLREMAEQQGLEQDERRLPAHAARRIGCFKAKLLEQIFSELQASRTGRHQGPIVGEGAVETAADEALRVRRLGREHGHPGVAHQRDAPRRARACRCG